MRAAWCPATASKWQGVWRGSSGRSSDTCTRTRAGIRAYTDLPGVLAYGATEQEAVARVQALALRSLADRLENGEPAPSLLLLDFRAAYMMAKKLAPVCSPALPSTPGFIPKICSRQFLAPRYHHQLQLTAHGRMRAARAILFERCNCTKRYTSPEHRQKWSCFRTVRPPDC